MLSKPEDPSTNCASCCLDCIPKTRVLCTGGLSPRLKGRCRRPLQCWMLGPMGVLMENCGAQRQGPLGWQCTKTMGEENSFGKCMTGPPGKRGHSNTCTRPLFNRYSRLPETATPQAAFPSFSAVNNRNTLPSVAEITLTLDLPTPITSPVQVNATRLQSTLGPMRLTDCPSIDISLMDSLSLTAKCLPSGAKQMLHPFAAVLILLTSAPVV